MPSQRNFDADRTLPARGSSGSAQLTLTRETQDTGALRWCWRGRGPLAALTLVAFLSGTFAPGIAAAADIAAQAGAGQMLPLATFSSASAADAAPSASDALVAPAGKPVGGAAPVSADSVTTDLDGTRVLTTAGQAIEAPLGDPAGPPVGGSKTGVSSQVISMPKGAGSVDGMGESFSTQLSTGSASFSVPFMLPKARGGAQPSLSLSYSSSGGFGVAGVGWSVGAPFIARQTDRGIPKYDDRASWHAEQDRFVFNGGQELVPICVVGSVDQGCDGRLLTDPETSQSEVLPVWAAGHQYFRPRVEGSFQRFFWSPDHLTWRVQDKSGVTMELGMPLDGSKDQTAIERNPDESSEIYRWNLVRQYDMYGDAHPALGNPAPHNVVVYKYTQEGGTAHLADVFDTTPAADPKTTDTARYAHHTHLEWEQRSDPTFSYRTGWRMEQNLRLKRVDVTSKSFNEGEAGPRHLVRRYHLGYDADYTQSLLASLQLEGRCTANEVNAPAEAANQLLPATTCGRLPAMTFEYSHVAGFTSAGVENDKRLPGFEAVDARVVEMKNSPAHSLDEGRTALFDINSDSLPDVLVTDPGLYGNGHGVFFNGAKGRANAFGDVELIGVKGVLGAKAKDITLSNFNLNPLDLDGDAIVNLLHMPRQKTYSIYTPERQASGWQWLGRVVETASGQDPKLDFGKDSFETQVVDVNFDGLVDVVVSTGTELETFLSLGRYPGGDGQFGQASWTGPASALIENEPITACLPHSSTPVRFSDKDIKIADMNGDGIADILRVRRGQMQYWPGRGNGYWGTGRRDDCLAGEFGVDRYLTMANSPVFSDIGGTSLRIEDVNGDGLPDLVQVRYDEVDLWLNINGSAWTERHIIKGTPHSPSFASRVQLVDINGSGTPDILWGEAGNYRYIDLAGGTRPRLLTHVANGLGKTTDIEYSTSAAQMLAAERAGNAWQKHMPSGVTIIEAYTDSDNLRIAGGAPGKYRTEFVYRDPVYEGRQREFRGFASARQVKVGDDNSPTNINESTFLLGECVDELTSDGGTRCSYAERWRDNPREALKGLVATVENFDESGVYFSTEHSQYRLRRLYTGLDGRDVRHAFESGKRRILYDNSPFVAGTSLRKGVPTVTLERELGISEDTQFVDLPLRSATNTAETTTGSAVDVFGNTTSSVDNGCIAGSACPTSDVGMAPDEVIAQVELSARPTSEPTGWLWRSVETYVTGSAHAAPAGGLLKRNRTYNTYDVFGALTRVERELSGTLALERFHESGGTKGVAFANDPLGASLDGRIFVSASTYNALGKPTRNAGAGNRCADLSYDAAYGDLISLETTFSQGCGLGPMATGAQSYDRAFALITVAVNQQGQPTAVVYDAWGRSVQLTKPHPTLAGALSAAPSVKVEYFLPPDLASGSAYSLIHTLTQDSTDAAVEGYLESWAFQDGLGRAILTLKEADAAALDAGAWIAADFSEYDAKGAVRRKFLNFFYNGTPQAFALGAIPNAAYARERYDAFSRQRQAYDVDGTVTLQSTYHALSTDIWDAADLEAGPHQGTFASSRTDGHGRAIASVERFRGTGAIEQREVRTQYLPTNEPEVVTRVRVGSADPPVVRWFKFDSLGRSLLNVEPNLTTNFSPNPASDASPGPGKIKAWRYAYNDAGELVGSSDARGCGVNYLYDGAGRILAEDYSPCLAVHAPYTAARLDLADKTGIEVLYQYGDRPDLRPSSLLAPPGYNTASPFLHGLPVAVHDRAETTWRTLDGRGREVRVDRRVAQPTAIDAFATRYASRWYTKETRYDGADREVVATTGASVADLLGSVVPGTPFSSAVTTEYSRRGSVKSVAGSYGALVTALERSADDLMRTITYGDLAQTTTSFAYDGRRRLATLQTYRGMPSAWLSPPGSYLPVPTPNGAPSTFQLLLQDDQFSYDVVNNPLEVRDWRNAEEWPAGSKPVTRRMQYDNLYRVNRIDYEQTGGQDSWISPFAAENGTSLDQQDRRRAKPNPHVAFDKRLRYQTYEYDWLGNTAESSDDASGFGDRSLGVITNATSGGTQAKPYQLKAASNSGAGTRDGLLSALYDAAGNLTRMNVRRNGPCLPAGALCSQRFDYQWDEAGRLARARRWDSSGAALGLPGDPLPVSAPAADLAYRYDSENARVLKSATDAAGVAVHTVYLFNSLELRRSAWLPNGGAGVPDYELSKWTEVPYLFGHKVRLARVLWHDADPGLDEMPATNGGKLHVVLELRDYLGSTAVMLDKGTSELVERTTYQAYGGPDSDYRPARWKSFREDYRFTGKEEDSEVGLQFFERRFYSPLLSRWVSADPLATHQLEQAELNLYAYVDGMPLRATDPTGLFKVPIHEEITANALRQAGATNISWDAIVAGHKRADYLGQLQPQYHFDNSEFKAGFAHVDSTLAGVKRNFAEYTLGPTQRAEAKSFALGVTLHAVQDFYAHSNYVDLYYDFSQQEKRSQTVPTFSEVFDEKNAAYGDNADFRNWLKAGNHKIRSGFFSIFQGGTYNIARAHGHGTLAKDGPSDDVHMDAKHFMARDVAQRDSADVIKNMKAFSGRENAPIADGEPANDYAPADPSGVPLVP